MDIVIKGHRSVEGFLKENYRKYALIFYTNSETTNYPLAVKNAATDFVHFPLDDVDHYEYRLYQAPTMVDVEQAIAFGKDKDRLICCCHAGVSRSSSTAYAIGCAKEGPDKALELLTPGYHYPNRLIVALAAKYLNDKSVWTKFVEWQKENAGMDPSGGGSYPGLYLEKMGLSIT